MIAAYIIKWANTESINYQDWKLITQFYMTLKTCTKQRSKQLKFSLSQWTNLFAQSETCKTWASGLATTSPGW